MLYNLKRGLSKRYNKVVHRLGRRDLDAALARVNLEPGLTVCVHSSLSRLGYVEGGADSVVDAVMELVGETGTVLMPSYPTGAAMAYYLDSGEIFDVRRSPSKVGAITEVFRRRPGVLRSLHPSNPVAAWGRGAANLLQDHERSLTPYGEETPFGRLSRIEDGFVLMLDTHVQSYLHYVQERVAFPNLYLPGERSVAFVDWSGQERTMRTRVMRPRIPYYVAIPADSGNAPDWAVLHDFALIFPRRHERTVRELDYRFAGYPRLFQRRAELEKAGILRTARLGKGEIGLLHVKGFTQRLEPELRELIDRFRDAYDGAGIAALDLPYT